MVATTGAFAVATFRDGWFRTGVAKADSPVTAAELEDWLKERIARYKLPKRFLFWSELPKSGYGKITKKDIRERLATAGEA